MEELRLVTEKRAEFINITSSINKTVKDSGLKNGLCIVFCPHTTAALTINENADPDVITDILSYLNKLIPEKDSFLHLEGNSDAHIKSSLFGSTLNIIVKDSVLFLGVWQGVYFCEFDGPRERKVYINLIKSS